MTQMMIIQWDGSGGVDGGDGITKTPWASSEENGIFAEMLAL